MARAVEAAVAPTSAAPIGRDYRTAITVDPDVHAGVLEAAAEEGVSVSAWMTNAARRALVVRNGLAGVEEWAAEHGALSDSEMANAGRGGSFSFLNIGLDTTDPLAVATKGMFAQPVDVWICTASPAGATENRLFEHGPFHHEIALV